MMAGFRIAHSFSDQTPKVKPTKKVSYLAFLHKLPCVISGKYGVEAAHISFANPYYMHYGRGKGHKAHDLWCLPLSPEAHREQHNGNEADWWAKQGIDPHELALTLYGAWSSLGDQAEPFCVARINKGLALTNRLRSAS